MLYKLKPFSTARFVIPAIALVVSLFFTGCSHGAGTFVAGNLSGNNSGSSGNNGGASGGNTSTNFTVTKSTKVTMPGNVVVAAGDPSVGRVFVSVNRKDASGKLIGAVVAVDLKTASIVATIPAPSGYTGRMVANRTTHRLYVVFGGATSSIGVIDMTTNRLIKTVPLKQNASSFDLALDEAANKVYSATNNIGASPTVTILDGVTNTITADVAIPHTGILLAANSVSHRVFVMAQDFTVQSTPTYIYEIAGDTGQLISTNQIAGIPVSIAADAQSNQVLCVTAPTYFGIGTFHTLTPDRHASRDIWDVLAIKDANSALYVHTAMGFSANSKPAFTCEYYDKSDNHRLSVYLRAEGLTELIGDIVLKTDFNSGNSQVSFAAPVQPPLVVTTITFLVLTPTSSPSGTTPIDVSNIEIDEVM